MVLNGEIMNVVHIINKRSHINTIEKFCICTDTKLDNQLDDGNTVTPDTLFEVIIRNDVSL
jgi:hypothetical protein